MTSAKSAVEQIIRQGWGLHAPAWCAVNWRAAGSQAGREGVPFHRLSFPLCCHQVGVSPKPR